MKTEGNYCVRMPLLFFLFILLLPSPSPAATMGDYCITPPYIVGGIKPNLLLMFDNSSSMFDLNYVDKGTGTRTPAFCYDQTYRGAIVANKVTNLYEGYFDVDTYYKYNQTSGYFEVSTTTPQFPASCSKRLADTLCIDLDTSTPKKVTNFVARGNYLNWLTASKFDIQKAILTGGKYSGGNIIAESRGCVGRGYIKEALTADYSEGGTNTSLGITFSIKGAPDPVNFTAPSHGGQSYIYIYEGDYNAGNCQQAIDLYNTCHEMSCKTDLTNATSLCLNITNLTDLATKSKIIYKQSVQECLQYKINGTVGNDAVQSIKGGGSSVSCTNLYNGRAAATPACTDGPKCIKAGDPDLLCSDDYTGGCFTGVYDSGTKTWSDLWTKTIEVDSINYTGDDCIIKKHNQYCAMFDTSPVVDPTDDASTTATSSNVPAIISDLGVEGQLKAPLKLSAVADDKVTVKNHTSEPIGLIKDFETRIRMGALAFNYNGSLTECVNLSTDPIPCPKICSAGTARSCGSNIDCDTYTTAAGTCNSITSGVCKKGSNTTTTACSVNSDCNALGNGYSCSTSTALRCSNNTAKSCTVANQATTCAGQLANYSCVADTTNKDAAKIYHYVGQGTCSNNNTIMCAKDEQCGSGNKCNSSGVGSHSSGLVNVIDNLTGATWTPFAEAFYDAIGYFAKGRNGDGTLSTTTSRDDLILNPGVDYALNMNPSQHRCQSNNVLIISDGMSTADRNPYVANLAGLYNDGDGNITTTTSLATDCPKFKGSKNLDDLTWLGKHRDINQFSKTVASTTAPTERSQYISSHVVFSGADNGESGECNTTTMMTQAAVNGGTTLLQATNFSELKAKIKKALDDVAAGTASGTAASILSNSEGSGANILQAVFYPRKIFTNSTEADWIGELQNLWYYVDPFIGNSTVREDTIYNGGDHVLNLLDDYVASFYFDTPETKVRRYRDTDGNGSGDTLVDTVYPDDVKSIWRAGNQLWARTSPRDIKTTINGTSLIDFSTDNVADLQTNLQGTSSLEAEKIIKYVHGIDLAKLSTSDTYYDPNYRNRTVTTKNFLTGATDTRVWKLGDIISSTPRLQSSLKQNAYNLAPPAGYSDTSYAEYTNTVEYKGRGMVYVGANDGMIHAFKLGLLNVASIGDQKATLTGTGLGEEAWAFIPKNVLPYLKYLGDPSYNHLYLVDGTSVVTDLSICAPGQCAGAYWNAAKNLASWRTVLIGGMGLGGAAKNSTDSCTADLNIDGSVDNKDCVKTPINGVGYSSYFALDITVPATPSLLWEYSNPALGFATSGPAVIRTSSKKADGSPDNDKNGRWFAVFASGPTGPIDTEKSEFMGRSDQTLKIVVQDMKVPANSYIYDTGIANAFAGTISGGVIDSDRLSKSSNGFYQDDVIYIGYVQKDVDTNTWTKGGVLRLVITDDYNPDVAPAFNGAATPTFKLSKVIDGIGPVTTGIAKLQDKKNHNLWLYFGSGRYFFKQDDNNGQQKLFGIKEPCFKETVARSGGQTTKDDIDDKDTVCAGTALVLSDLEDQTAGTSDSIGTKKGWYIDLDPVNTPDGFGAERVITDPVAMTNGAVFFTTFKPTADICSFGGISYLWATKFDTGFQPPASALQGKALVQVSTGSFEEVDLSTAFTDKEKRRIGTPMSGKPPGDPPPIVSKSNLKPVKKILHIREK